MATYYVNASTGNNANNGTSSGTPWKTLAYAYDHSAANDTINLQTGVWHERLGLSKAGQTWKAQTGHTPVIDGNYHPGLFTEGGPAPYNIKLPNPNELGNMLAVEAGSLLGCGAADLTIDGLTVRNSGGRGIMVGDSAQRLIIRNCLIDFCYSACLSSENSTNRKKDCLIENNVATRGSMNRFDPKRFDYSDCTGDCVGQCIKLAGYEDLLCRNNVAAYSGGEGIDIGKLNIRVTFEDNVSFNHHHVHLYFMYSRDTIARRNLIFFAENLPITFAPDGKAAYGIRATDEKSGANRPGGPPPSQSGLQLYNNIVVGNGHLLGISGKDSRTHIDRLWVAFNTFVAGPYTKEGVHIDASFEPGWEHSGIFENNIIDMTAAPASMPISGGTVGSSVVFRNNCWSKTPTSNFRGTNDQVGSPNLVNGTRRVTATWSEGPGVPAYSTDPDDYRLTANSTRCIDKASNGSAAGGFTPPNLTTDFAGASRGATKDIGAFEYGGVVAPRVTAQFGQAPNSGNAPLSVSFSDQSSGSGGAVINSWGWVFGDGQTSTERSPTHVYSVAGTYQAVLTVQDTVRGLTDTFTGPVITVGTPPVNTVTARFTRAPASGTAPLAVQFTDTSTKTGAAVINVWAWDFGDGGTATTQNPSHSYAAAGTYRATLTVQDTVRSLTSTFTGPETVVQAVTTDGVTAAFSASTLSGAAPLAVSFTDASTDTGAAVINVWEWDFGDGGTSTTASPSHTYQTAGVYRPRLTVRDTTKGLVHSVEGAAITVTAPPSGANVVIRQTRVALNTSDGVQTITAAGLSGLTPKRAILRVTRATADGVAADGAWLGMGYVTGQSNQVACAIASDHGVTASNTAGRWVDDAALLLIDGSGAVVLRATFADWTVNGMQLVLDWIGTPAAYLVTVEFAAGTAYQGYAAAAALGAAGSLATVNGGFAVDAARFMATWGAEDTAVAGAALSLGLAHRAGQQYVLERYYADGQGTTALTGRHYEDQVAQFRPSGTGWASVGVDAWSGQGITLKTQLSDINSGILVLLESFGGAASGVGVLTTPLATGAQDVELGFAPQAVTHLMSARPAAGVSSNATSGTIGLHSVTDDGEFADTIASEHGAATTNEQSLSDNAATLPAHDGGASLAGTTVLGPTKYTITWSAVPTAVRRWIYLAVAEGDVSAEPLVAEFVGEPRSGDTPLEVSFTDLSGPEPTSWAWEFGDGATSTLQHPTHTFREGGSFTVTLTVGDGTNTATVTKTNYVSAREVMRRRIVIGPYVMRPVTEDSVTVTKWDATYPDVEVGVMSAALELNHLPLRDDAVAPEPASGKVQVYHDATTDDLKVGRADGTTGTVDVT